jgi:parallel beta-helix repeat protein
VEVIKMGDKDIWKILVISVALAIVASSAAVFSAANSDTGIGEKRIEESGGKGIISLVPPPFIGVAGASGSYVAATNLDTGESFSSIQAAIDDLDTKGGHTITVNPGYHIENVNVRKSLTIKSTGGNPSDTVIKAADSGNPVISITTNNVSIIGIQTEGSSTDYAAGISLFNTSHCYIANCFATMNCIGISMGLSSNNRLYNNSASSNSGLGIILVSSTNNIIEHNVACDNELSGIFLSDSENNSVLNNTCSDNELNGIYIDGSACNRVTENTATRNGYSGIELWESEENVIENNLVLNNSRNGITLSLSDRNVVSNNLALNNGRDGINIDTANGNKIIGNNASYNKGSGISVYSSTSEIRGNVANSNFYKGIEVHNSDESIIEENICENNKMAKPDLVIKHASGTGHYPGNIPVNIRIENQGLRNAEPPFTVEVEAEYKRQYNVWYETKRVDVRNVLAPGKYVDVRITLKKHGLDWDGTFPITVYVDRWNSVVESNEDNNIYHGLGCIIRA